MALAAIAALAATGTPLLEVEDRGQLLPYDEDEKVKVRVAGLASVYISAWELERTDAVVALGLMCVAGAAIAVACVFARVGGAQQARLAWFYGLLGAAAGWLSLDETLSLHEAIGQTLERWLGMPPLVERPDDAVFALYLLPALGLLWAFRAEALASRRARWLLAAALACFALTVAVDLDGSATDLEELLEVVVALLLVAAFVFLTDHHISARLRAAAPGHPST